MTDPFHMAWFLNYMSPDWNTPWSGRDGTTWLNGEFYVDMARSLERAGFDYMMFEDSVMVPDIYGGSAETDLKYGVWAPKLDPVPLVPVLTRATERVGVIATMSTSFYSPFGLARCVQTLDHLTEGRAGWNVVTSSEDLAAKNFGMDRLPEHDERYDRADEFVEVVKKLWDSWEPGAIVANRETDTYIDHTRVHRIDHQGTYFSSRGPLNTPPGPQGHPVLCQAGSSNRGREFAARNADTVLANPKGIDAMKQYREDIRQRMIRYGRKPDDCKVLYIVYPILGATMAEADAKRDALFANVDRRVDYRLAQLSGQTEIDFKQFDLDAPLPEDIHTNGHQGTLEIFKAFAKGKTLREAAAGMTNGAMNLVGTPDAVAGEMEEIMGEVGGDGFLINAPKVSRRYVDEITNGLIPELQRRGLTRRHYDYGTLRENLLAF